MIHPDAVEAAQLVDRLERLSRSGEPAGTGTSLNPAQWEALRYLARANRFSRTPAALADYLGSTRGTISQTVIALEQKGLVGRATSPRDRRSVELSVSVAGTAALADDPLLSLARDIEAGAAPQLADLLTGLRAALSRRLSRNGGRAFGLCRICRHFREGANADTAAPHRCALLDEALGDADSRAICAEQVPA